MSKDTSVVFKKSAQLDAPARRKSSTSDAIAVQFSGSPHHEHTKIAESSQFVAFQTALGSVPLADMPWSEYVSRGACDMLSSSLNVAFDAVESHDLRAAMATAATLTRGKIPAHSPLLKLKSPESIGRQIEKRVLPRIATAAAAAPPRMEMADFTLAYNLPEIPSWKLGYTPRFAAAGSAAPPATRLHIDTRPRDLTERAMEVDLRIPSPPSSSVSILSPFTACANQRAARVQTALDKSNFDSPTKWESLAESGGALDDDVPNNDDEEPSDWSYMLSLALSRREQASQKLKEMDEQLQVCRRARMIFGCCSRVLTRPYRIFPSTCRRRHAVLDHCALQALNS
jgi:hypothetical protein